MIVGYHSPLPPAASGAADYAADLLSALRRHCEVRVGARSANVHLYQIGNNPLHREAHDLALQLPGVILLHDANLHHFYLGSLNREQYVDEFCRQYGAWQRSYAEQLWRDRARSGSDPRFFTTHPMLQRIARSAKAVVVHNPAAAAMVRRHAPETAVLVVPHYFEETHEEAYAVAKLRAELELRGADTLFAVFGHLRESKRLAPVLRAFARARQEVPRMRLLIAGKFVSEDFARAIEPLADAPGVIRMGFLPERSFRLYAHACDVGINLRYPSCGESSGIATRLMGIGKPVLLTEGPEQGMLPEATWLPVPAGVAEEAALADWMGTLARDKRIGAEIGRRAAEHIRSEHDLRKVAHQMVSVLQRYAV